MARSRPLQLNFCMKHWLRICGLLVLAAGVIPDLANAIAKEPSPYAAAITAQRNPGEFPKDFTASMYRNLLARVSFGQPESIVEPLLYLAHADSLQPDVQNAAAVAIFLGRSVRRGRALDFASQAVRQDPNNPVFHVVHVIVDSNRTLLSTDGALLLSKDAAHEIQSTVEKLEQGTPNMRLLAEIVRSVGPDSRNPQFPFVLPSFERLIDNPGVLFTTPDSKSFAVIEDKIRARILQASAEATEAQKSATKAKRWFEDLQRQWTTASPENKDRLLRESQQKREEFERWMAVAQEKIARVTAEYASLDALLKNDYIQLGKLRMVDEGNDTTPAVGDSATVLTASAQTEESAGAASEAASTGELVSGLNRYYALVIGNKDYQHVPKLKTPLQDAQAVAELLHSKYGFSVRTLLNATRSQLINALYSLRSLPKNTDNVLVFYAGHGYFDEISNTGYWIPVDAEEASPANWVSNADITAQLRAVSAKRVLVIADSCYSGTLTRDLTVASPDADSLKKIVGRRARMVMTSGGNEPVVDVGANGYSVFTNALIGTLNENHSLIETTRLFYLVRSRVLNSGMSEQVPLLSTIRDAEHDGGEFFFFPHSAAAAK